MTLTLTHLPTLGAAALTVEQVTVLFLSVAVLLGLARLLGEVAVMLRQPAVLGEIAAGVLLGPTLLGAFAPGTYALLFPVPGPAGNGVVGIAHEALFVLSAALLLLVAGLEVELSSVWRQGRRALWVAMASMVVPFAFGFGLAWLAPLWIGYREPTPPMAFALFFGVALSITALPVIAKVLMDLNLSRSDFGTIVISSAMLNDLLGWFGFALILAMTPAANGSGGGGASDVGLTILFTVLFVALALTLLRFVIHRSLPWIQAHCTWPAGVVGLIIVLALLGGALTEWIGIHAIFGAFIVGIAVGDSRHLRNQTRSTVNTFINSVFAPLFFASIGLRVNFVESFNLKYVVVVLLIAIVGKVVGAYLGARRAGISKRESGAIGMAMCARGAMEIILGQMALTYGIIGEELFVAIVIMALLTSLISGPAIERLLARPHQRRLRDFLTDKLFVPRLGATDSRDAITKLTAKAAEVTGLPAEPLFNAAWEREQIASNGIGNQVAIPHARVAGISKPVVVLGLDTDGVDFNAPDGKAATIILLLLTPVNDPSSQLELLALVAQSFSDAATRSAVMEAQTYTELLAALSVTTAKTH